MRKTGNSTCVLKPFKKEQHSISDFNDIVNLTEDVMLTSAVQARAQHECYGFNFKLLLAFHKNAILSTQR